MTEEIRIVALRGQVLAVHLQPTICGIMNNNPTDSIYRSGSGVLLTISDKYFVLSAAHVLKNVRSTIAIPLGTTPEKCTFEIFNLIVDEDLDIGFIELRGDQIQAFIAEQPFDEIRILKNPINLDRVTYNINYENVFYITGYPIDYRQYHGERDERYYVSVQPMVYSTVCIQDLKKDGPEFSLEYSWLEQGIVSEDQTIDIPDPHGISGGGVWQEGNPSLRFPQNVNLVGIAIEWNSKQGYINVIKIEHMINLIRNEYPDLI
jgi:hypothetical protein